MRIELFEQTDNKFDQPCAYVHGWLGPTLSVNYEWKVQRILNHLSRMEFPTLNQLDQSISVFRVVGW